MDTIRAYMPRLLDGFLVTVEVTLLGICVALVVAVILGSARCSGKRLIRWPASVVVETLRGTSVIVQLFWGFYVLPTITDDQIPPMLAAIVVLGLNSGSYAAEAVRGAIQGVPRGQHDAAVSLGLTPFRRLRRVTFPQALPVMLPPFGTAAIDLMKASSIVGFVNVHDLTFWTEQLRTITGDALPIYLVALVMYFALALVLSAVFRAIENALPLRRIERAMHKGRPPDHGVLLPPSPAKGIEGMAP